MAVIVDEVAGTVTFTDCSVTFPYSFDATTGVGTITITPAGGVANFPLGIEGSSGMPSDITIIAHVVDPDDPLPTPNPTKTVIDPGGPGEAAHYQYDLYVHQGIEGPSGAFAIFDGTDLSGTVVAKYALVINDDEDGVTYAPLPYSERYWPTTVNSTASSNTTPRAITTVTIPAKPHPQRVNPFGSIVVTGASDVRVDYVAYLGDPDAGGQEIGRVSGLACGTAGVYQGFMLPRTPPGSASSWGRLAAGVGGSVYFRAINVGNASANWSTSNTTTHAEVISDAVL